MRVFLGFNRKRPLSSLLQILAKCLTVLICMLLVLWFGLARLIGPIYTCREIEGSIVPARRYLLPFCNWQPPISKENLPTDHEQREPARANDSGSRDLITGGGADGR
jgi:hypothetical protein